MGRMNLRCACGQAFVVDSKLFDTAEFARCPGCGKKVGIDGPILEGPAPRRPAARPAIKDMKKTHLILGGIGIGAVLFFGILIPILFMSGGKKDKEIASSGHAPRAVPRKSGDGVRFNWSPKPYDEGKIEEVEKSIIEALK